MLINSWDRNMMLNASVSVRIALCVFFLALSGISNAQTDQHVTWADSVIDAIRNPESLSIQTKLDLLERTSSVYDSAGMVCKFHDAQARYAGFLSDAGEAEKALALLLEVEEQAPQNDCGDETYMIALSNLVYVYLQMDELALVDSLSSAALTIWNSEWEFYRPKLAILNNYAVSSAYQGDFGRASKLFRQLKVWSLEFGSAGYISQALANLGTIKGIEGDLDSAYFFIKQASDRALLTEDLDTHIPSLINLAQIERQRNNPSLAKALLDSAERVADENGNLELVGAVQNARSENYEATGQYQMSLEALKEYIETHEKFVSEERVRAVSEMQEKYESEKKARQIKALEVKNLDTELENERISNSRKFIFFGLIFIVLVAVGLGNRLLFVRKSRKAIKKEKDRSEDLLHNILPEQVAAELKEKGHSDAQLFEQTTVLFTDFKGFTAMSEQVSPRELVNDLNICFSEFDAITTKYGIEKIKTIGDAYMAAGGLPVPTPGHTKNVVLAALEMVAFVEAGKQRKIEQSLPFFEVRIGIHTGPVVAGIVGVKKFQYDIWGDTVNTASRMESSGQVGRVNISQSTYELIKDDTEFAFENRGKIQAKGKGEMEMWFVSKRKRLPAQ